MRKKVAVLAVLMIILVGGGVTFLGLGLPESATHFGLWMRMIGITFMSPTLAQYDFGSNMFDVVYVIVNPSASWHVLYPKTLELTVPGYTLLAATDVGNFDAVTIAPCAAGLLDFAFKEVGNSPVPADGTFSVSFAMTYVLDSAIWTASNQQASTYTGSVHIFEVPAYQPPSSPSGPNLNACQIHTLALGLLVGLVIDLALIPVVAYRLRAKPNIGESAGD
jgi:hypothetical protein